MRKFSLFTVFCLALGLVSSAGAMNRCVENGKVLITDRPCAGAAPASLAEGAPQTKVLGDAQNSAYASLYGEWRGQVQFMAMQRGLPVAEAHAVVPLVLKIEAGGKVTGAATENGCRVSGVAFPGFSKDILTLDVTLSGCAYQGYNRRLGGSLALMSAQKYAQFWIYAMPIDVLRPSGMSYEIKGSLRR